MKFSTVIFDLDGTLLNTLGDLTSSVNAVMSAHGFPTLSAHDVQQRVGHGIRNLMAKSVPEGTDEATIDVCMDEMISYYSKHLNVHTRAYDGVPAASISWTKPRPSWRPSRASSPRRSSR